MQICSGYGIEKSLEEFRKHSQYSNGRDKRRKKCAYEKDKESRRKYNKTHPEVVREQGRRRRAKDRQRVLDKFGGKCAHCGFDDPRALQIDHVNGGGKKEIKEIGQYACQVKARNDSSGAYQLLCANCNWIKRFDNNEINIKPPQQRISA